MAINKSESETYKTPLHRLGNSFFVKNIKILLIMIKVDSFLLFLRMYKTSKIFYYEEKFLFSIGCIIV